MREWTFTLLSKLPFWELESQWTPEFLKGDRRGQNPLVWRVLYIIGKLLKPGCLKWVRVTHLDIWNTSYGPKKGRESNWQLDFRPLKVRNGPDFLACRWHVTYHWKNWQGPQLCFKIHCNWMSTHNVMGLQNHESPNFRNFETPIWESRDKMLLGCGPRGEAHIKGKVVASFKSGPWSVLWVRVYSWLVLAPKLFKLCTNQLVVWFVQIHMID